MHMRLPGLAALALVGALGTLVAGCASEATRAPGPLRVVTTTAILGEFTRGVAGPDASVVSLIPAGSDPHSFEPPSQVARDIAAADVIVVNGYHLEGNLLEVVAENRRSSAAVVVASTGLPALSGAHEDGDEERPPEGLPAPAVDEGDPHMWLDPELAARYVENIAAALASADGAHADAYRERARIQAERLRALQRELATTLAPIPPEHRRIVVFHDAFAYFARSFGFEVAAGVLPGDGGREPSARDVAELVSLVRREGVPAVYKEPQFPSGVLDAVARETNVRVLELYSDAFGGAVGTYEEMMRANARALVQGLATPAPQ